MGKLNLAARTLDTEIVRDGLCAVGALEENPSSAQMYFVVGGVATQSYLPTACRRPTSDIDLAILRPLSFSEFKDFSNPASEWLGDHGYKSVLSKGHNSFHLIYSDGDNNAAVIEFSRKSPNYFGKVAKRLGEEFDRTRVKIIDGRDISCRFSSPEDIAVPKLVRSINALARNSHLESYIPFEGENRISDDDLKRHLEYIAKLREEAIIHIGDLSLAQKLRFYSDLFDIRLLSEVAGYNEDDLNDSMKNWATFSLASKAALEIHDRVLPRISFNLEGPKISEKK